MKTMVLPSSCLQLDELLLHLAADQRVERGERLVHEQHVGVGGEGAGEADALLHAAGQLARAACRPSPSRPTRSRTRAGALAALGARRRPGPRGRRRRCRARCGAAAARSAGTPWRRLRRRTSRSCFGGDAGDRRSPSTVDGARGRLEQAVEHADQRRLAGAGQAHDDEDLALLHLEGGVDDGGGAERAQFVAGLPGRESLDDLARFLAEYFVDIVHLDGNRVGHVFSRRAQACGILRSKSGSMRTAARVVTTGSGTDARTPPIKRRRPVRQKRIGGCAGAAMGPPPTSQDHTFECATLLRHTRPRTSVSAFMAVNRA